MTEKEKEKAIKLFERVKKIRERIYRLSDDLYRCTGQLEDLRMSIDCSLEQVTIATELLDDAAEALSCEAEPPQLLKKRGRSR